MKKILPLIIAVGGLGVFFYLKLKAKADEKKATEENKQSTPPIIAPPIIAPATTLPAPLPPPPNEVSPSYSNWWSQNFNKNSPDSIKKFKTTILLSSDAGTKKSEEIKSALLGFNNFGKVEVVFRDLGYQSQVTSLAYWFNKKYSIDLYNFLNDELYDSEMKKIEDSIKTLPTGKSY